MAEHDPRRNARTAAVLRRLVAGSVLVMAAAQSAAAGEAEDLFSREIRPYLAERCYSCHASGGRKEYDLALDWAGGLRDGGESGPAVVPGKPAESLLLAALEQKDGLRMPKGGPAPPAAVVAAVKRWIELGAPDPRDRPPTAEEFARETSWEAIFARRKTWWSLRPLTRPAVPPSPAGTHPIDAFLGPRLAAAGLAPSPPADRATLIRRLSFDLVGLPPEPADVAAFVADPAPDAYERLVDRLLASPHHGERWGRHWLDTVRYTESHGFERDQPRPNAWHYRDYVIASFNDDKPYDLFMREQVAGDVIEPVTRDGIVATSLLVCGSFDEAGNSQSNLTQRATTREEELEDLVGTIGQTFLGLTINCARCHDHKFDPVSQAEYYRVKSVFEGVRHGERPIATPAEARARDDLLAGLRAGLAEREKVVARLDAAGLALARAKPAAEPGRSRAGPAPAVQFAFDDASETVASGRLHGGAKIVDGRLVLPSGGEGYFASGPLPIDLAAKTLEAWVVIDGLAQGGGAVISIENAADRDFDAVVYGERQRRKWVAGSGNFRRTRDVEAPEESAKEGEIIHVAAVYAADGSIALYRNGVPYGAAYTPASAPRSFKAGEARALIGLRHLGASNGHFFGAILRAAVHDRALTPEEVAASAASGGHTIPQEEILAALSPDERAERAAAVAAAAELRRRIGSVPPLPVSYCGTRRAPEPTAVLARGDVTKPGEIVAAAGLAAIDHPTATFGLPPTAPEAARRLAFAGWLADPANPLPARVMVNRIWQFHFGQGIVATPSDFGASAAPPTHPELLDWLAAEFAAGGFRMKALHRLIVTSAAYRMSSAARAECLAVDADNTLLWRFAPRRLEAEAVRDAMLAVGGSLNPAIGGPSFEPFTITRFNAVFYEPFDKDAPEFNRRTVYRMNVNSGKEPLLDVLDCPDPSVKTPKRGSTVTPLQALALMNNPFVQRQAEGLARRSLAEAGDDPARGVQAAYRRALGREATGPELDRALAVVGDRGLASVCWALLNSTEFVHVR